MSNCPYCGAIPEDDQHFKCGSFNGSEAMDNRSPDCHIRQLEQQIACLRTKLEEIDQIHVKDLRRVYEMGYLEGAEAMHNERAHDE